MDIEWISDLNEKTTRIEIPAIRYSPAVNYAWRTGKLTADAANILMQIVGFSKDVGFCRVTNAQLAWMMGRVSKATVVRNLRALIAAGWASTELPKGTNGASRKLVPNWEKIAAKAPLFAIPQKLLSHPEWKPEHMKFFPKTIFSQPEDCDFG